MATAVQVRTRPLKPGFGAEILDVDLQHADDATLDAVVDTFHKHGAILLRDQTMTPADLTAFVARFGEPEDHTLKEFTVAGYPKVYRLSNRSSTASRSAPTTTASAGTPTIPTRPSR